MGGTCGGLLDAAAVVVPAAMGGGKGGRKRMARRSPPNKVKRYHRQQPATGSIHKAEKKKKRKVSPPIASREGTLASASSPPSGQKKEKVNKIASCLPPFIPNRGRRKKVPYPWKKRKEGKRGKRGGPIAASSQGQEPGGLVDHYLERWEVKKKKKKKALFNPAAGIPTLHWHVIPSSSLTKKGGKLAILPFSIAVMRKKVDLLPGAGILRQKGDRRR